MTKPSDILPQLGDALLEGAKHNAPEFMINEVLYLDASGNVIGPKRWARVNPTALVFDTMTGRKFKLRVEEHVGAFTDDLDDVAKEIAVGQTYGEGWDAIINVDLQAVADQIAACVRVKADDPRIKYQRDEVQINIATSLPSTKVDGVVRTRWKKELTDRVRQKMERCGWIPVSKNRFRPLFQGAALAEFDKLSEAERFALARAALRLQRANEDKSD